MTLSIEAIASKIEKLERLAAGAGTPEEAAAASAKAAALMEEYSISRVQVEESAGIAPAHYGHQDVVTNFSWKVNLINTIGRDYQCLLVKLQGTGQYAQQVRDSTRVDVFGHRDNVRVTLEQFAWLSGEVERMAESAWKAEGMASGARKWAWQHSYAHGVTDAIVNRLYRARAERRAQRTETMSTALVVVENQARATRDSVYANLRSGGSRGGARGEYGARESGRRDGRSMGLDRTRNVEGGASRRIGQ